MAIRQSIQRRRAAGRGPASPRTRPQGRDEEQAKEKQAMSQTDWDGHGYGWFRVGGPAKAVNLRRVENPFEKSPNVGKTSRVNQNAYAAYPHSVLRPRWSGFALGRRHVLVLEWERECGGIRRSQDRLRSGALQWCGVHRAGQLFPRRGLDQGGRAGLPEVPQGGRRCGRHETCAGGSDTGKDAGGSDEAQSCGLCRCRQAAGEE
ncbi:hypothetical protein CfE428DRAFT_3813 [Chthoniobacter flavus Ellin428]|uniref:Uncharacterized protein n=1 Tax=Chthoniobacter flavus Ellin428 TaxID=497964 RepID=B4D4H5_9BACT|nr:hypothetical protein CfE428DRAFT_3813 [Chthoniobacter flavus Ellin428]